MRLPSIPSASAAVPSSSAPAARPVVFDLRSLPPQLAASPAIREHAGRDLFISSAWISTETARGLNERQQRVLRDLIAHFRTGSLDLNEEFGPGSMLLHFNNAELGPCEAACGLNEQGEVQSIVIRPQGRPEILRLNKAPLQEAASAAASSSGKARQRQLQREMEAVIRQRLEKKGLSSQQLDKIKKNGSAKALQAVDDNWDALQKLGLTKDDIVKIAANRGGALALEAVIENWGKLTTLEWVDQDNKKDKLSKDDIVKIAANSSGALALKAVIKNWGKLTTLEGGDKDNKKDKLSKDDIVKIAGNDGGAQAQQAVLENWDALQKLGLSKDDIVKIAANDGGAQALKAVLKNWDALQELGYSKDAIVKIAANIGGARSLKTIAQKQSTSEDNVEIAGSSSSTPASQANITDKLKDLGLEEKHIVKIASNSGGMHALQAVLKHWDALQKLGLTKDDIVNIAGNRGGAQALQTIIENWDALQSLGLTKDDIVKIAANGGGAQALKAVLENWPKLTRLEWVDQDNKKDKLSKDDIVHIASKAGAKKMLEAIASRESWQDLLSRQELVRLTSPCRSASSALDWYLTYHARLLQSGVPKQKIITAAISLQSGHKKKVLEQAGVEAEPASRRKRGTAPTAVPAKRIKTETPEIPQSFPSNFPAPTRDLEIERINTVQALHTPVTVYPMIDLTDQNGTAIEMSVLRVRHTDQAQLVTGKQTYDAALDRMFPIRDPANPAQVHPDYADADKPMQCAEGVRLLGVQFLKNGAKTTKFSSRPKMREMDEKALWDMLHTHFGSDHLYPSRRGFNAKKTFIDALLASCRQEMQACIKGEAPPSVQRVQVVEVTAEHCDSPTEAGALQGQYGGVLVDYAKEQQPSLRNGRIVCLFAGAPLSTEEARDAYFAQLGQEVADQAQHDYSARVRQHGTRKKHVDWAPYGGGNMAQYFNSSFNTDGEVDPERCNACFMPVTFKLQDKEGKERTETMLAVIQYRPIEPGKQIKLDYGEKYKLAQEAPTP